MATPRFLQLADVAEVLNISAAQAYALVRSGELPAIKIDDAPPTVEGYDVVKPTLSFTGLYDGTNQPSIEYMSTDITL